MKELMHQAFWTFQAQMTPFIAAVPPWLLWLAAAPWWRVAVAGLCASVLAAMNFKNAMKELSHE